MQTVIRVFENRRLAQTALDRLLQAGFQRENVHLQEGAAQANTALTADPRALTSAETGPERGLLSSVGRFFASLVGEDPPHGYVDRYSAAIWHGHPVIVVEANGAEATSRAAVILAEAGGVDIDERAARWHAAGLDAGTGSPVVDAGRARRMQPRHIFPGSVRALERERAVAAARARASSARENDTDARSQT